MKTNNFIYADLSTYTPKETISFYETVFGWKYYQYDDYYTAFIKNTEVTGLYETPDKFKQMRMPHFWMSYIQVDNVAETVEKARELGGIIELQSEIASNTKIALIRDLSGAGFTVYEGDQLTNVRTKNTANTLIWNELHVSDASKAIPFYEGIFDWKIIQKTSGLHAVYNSNNEYIADIVEIDNQYKGSYEYWVCTFGVKDIEITKKLILENGGTQIAVDADRMLFSDHSNEAFFYVKEVF
ncbi:VOC family protein [uncultured Kordia sp.]|uniref:VOC family protein n=1 Tax=uncultured Kordia sp. TaxID=507699 RepID=UPI00262CC002|nr:VOC family protein [uncultured Kordia sp.]